MTTVRPPRHTAPRHTAPRHTAPGPPGAGRPPHSPRALIVTIYGLYARSTGGAMSVAALITLMSEFDVDARAVRSLITRLKQRNIVQPKRIHGVAGYELSSDGRVLLDQGDRRIFGATDSRRSDGWLLAIFSIPESERAKRHTLRSQLGRLGFGTVSAGVWVGPTHLLAETRAVLDHYQLSPYVDLFQHAEFVGAVSSPLESWWDLQTLAAAYRSFLFTQRQVLRRWRRRQQTDDAAGFVDYVRAVTAWRRLAYLDPGLPGDRMAPRWPGRDAADLFEEIGDVLAVPADRHLREVTGRS